MSPARGGGRPGRREPPEFRRSGGDYRGGLSKAENTRDPKDRKPPSRPPGEGARRRARGTVRGAVLVGMGFMMAIEGTAARAPPPRGSPCRGHASPRARRTRHPTRGRGEANKCNGGMPPRWAMGEGGA